MAIFTPTIDIDPQARLLHAQQQAIKFSTPVAYVLAGLRFHPELQQDSTFRALLNGTLCYQPDYVLAMPIGLLITHLYHAVLHTGLQEDRMSQEHNPARYRLGFEAKCTQIQEEAGLPAILGALRVVEWDHKAVEDIIDQIPDVTKEQAEALCCLHLPLPKISTETETEQDTESEEEGSKGEEDSQSGKTDTKSGGPALFTAALANSVSLGKSIGEGSLGLSLLIDNLRAPQISWRELLRHTAGRLLGKRGRTFKRPHRRSGGVSYALKQTVILPGKNRALDNVTIVFDLSGSVVGDRRMVEDCCSELDAIFSFFHSSLHRVIFHESKIIDDFRARTLTEVLERLCGGGGTNFVPVYELLDKSLEPISLVIWITDLFGRHWDAAPPFPIIWLTGHNHDTPPSWGQLISLPPSSHV